MRRLGNSLYACRQPFFLAVGYNPSRISRVAKQILAIYRPYTKDSIGKSKGTFLEKASPTEIRDWIESSTEQISDEDFSEALHVAVRRGSNELVELFYEYCDINGVDREGMTPHLVAIDCGHSHLLKALLQNGAEYHRRCKVGEITFTPLSLAVKSDHLSCLEMLLEIGEEGIETHYTAKVGNLLHVAITFGKGTTLRYLLDNHQDECKPLLGMFNRFGQTPLMLAAAQNDPKAISLLKRNGASLEARDHDGLRAMDWAIKQENRDAIKRLRELGASILELHVDVDAISNPSLRHFVANLQAQQKHGFETLTGLSDRSIVNLALQGGGPKVIGPVGALHTLEKENLLAGIRRVAGTSASAFVASLLAVGYNPGEIEEALKKRDLLSLLDVPLYDLKAHALNVARAQGPFNSLLTTASDPISSGVGLFRLFHDKGLADGNVLHDWIEELIADKTGVNHFTYRELGERAEQSRFGYRHLWVCATQIHPSEKLLVFSSQHSETDEFRDVTLASGAAASGTLPGLFSPARLLFKSDKLPYSDPDKERRVVDGGLIRNLPLETWDEERYVREECPPELAKKPAYNAQTLALSFTPPGDSLQLPNAPHEKMTVRDFITHLWNVYNRIEAENRPDYSRQRTIFIDPGEISLLDIDLSREQQTKLIQRGEAAANAFFRQRTRPSLFHQPAPKLTIQEPQIETELSPSDLPPDLLESIVDRYKRHFAQHSSATNRSGVQPSLIYALSGCPGSGKTELAKQFVLQHHHEFCFAYWIDATNSESLASAHRDLCRQLQIPTEDRSDEEVGQALRDYLESHPFRRPWLLVYDGVTQPLQYPSFGGFVLTTSSDSELWGPKQTLHVPFPDLKEKTSSDQPPTADEIASKKKRIAALARHWKPFLDKLKKDDRIAHSLLHLLPAYQATGGAPSTELWGHLWDLGLDPTFMWHRLDLIALDFVRHNFVDEDSITQLHRSSKKERYEQSRFVLPPSLELVLLSGDADRSKIAYDYLSDYGNKVASSLEPIDPTEGSKHSLWRDNVSALLSSPYLDIPPEIRAKLYLQMGSVEEGLLKYDEAHDSFAAGFDELTKIDNPQTRKEAYRDISFLWAGLHRLLVTLLQKQAVRSSLALHGSSELDLFHGYQHLDDREFWRRPTMYSQTKYYLEALTTTLHDLDEKTSKDALRYFRLFKEALACGSSWYSFDSPFENWLNFQTQISGNTNTCTEIKNFLNELFHNLQGELLASISEQSCDILKKNLYRTRDTRRGNNLRVYLLEMAEHASHQGRFNEAYAYARTALNVFNNRSKKEAFNTEIDITSKRLALIERTLLEIESRDPNKTRSIEEIKADYRKLILHSDGIIFDHPSLKIPHKEDPDKK